jgi:hypothetical protein
VEACQLLVKRGASLTALDRWGMTPLVAALVEGHSHLAAILTPPKGESSIGSVVVS